MSEFEKWFKGQDFYTNMRFIHGDKLFDKDGDVYRVLPVQMSYQGWNTQRQRSKDEFVALTQEWHTKGWNARKAEIDDLRKINTNLYQGQQILDEHINELQKRIDEYKKLTTSIRNEFDLWSDDSEFADVIEAQIENLEALRGDSD